MGGSSNQETILGGNLFRSHLLFFNLEDSKIGIAVQSYCGRAAVKTEDTSNQYDYNIDQNVENGGTEESNADTPPTSNAQSSPNNQQSQMGPTDQKSKMSNPTGEVTSKSNANDKTITTTTNSVGDDVDGTLSSFSMNAAYYIAAVVLFCLYIALSIYSCRRCSRKRRRRQSM